MEKDSVYLWENMATSTIIYLMIKWFNFDSVEMNVSYRRDVESGVWITIKIERKTQTWHLDGQRPDIIQRRLIEFLDGQNIRNEYLIDRQQKQDE